MRIGVLSDTHDHLGYLRRAVDALCDLQVELALHAGDYVAPFVVNELQRLPCRVLGIFGNNDGERVGLTRRLSEIGQVQVQPLFLELEGCRIAMVHEPEPVEAFARSGLYDLHNLRAHAPAGAALRRRVPRAEPWRGVRLADGHPHLRRHHAA
jgi:putative phosphoesterase